VNLDPVTVLPPYWFVPDTFDAIPLKERIIKLVQMREQINSEIAYLKSLIQKPQKLANN
jgi:hypothetical protein